MNFFHFSTSGVIKLVIGPKGQGAESFSRIKNRYKNSERTWPVSRYLPLQPTAYRFPAQPYTTQFSLLSSAYHFRLLSHFSSFSSSLSLTLMLNFFGALANFSNPLRVCSNSLMICSSAVP